MAWKLELRIQLRTVEHLHPVVADHRIGKARFGRKQFRRPALELLQKTDLAVPSGDQ